MLKQCHKTRSKAVRRSIASRGTARIPLMCWLVLTTLPGMAPAQDITTAQIIKQETADAAAQNDAATDAQVLPPSRATQLRANLLAELEIIKLQTHALRRLNTHQNALKTALDAGDIHAITQTKFDHTLCHTIEIICALLPLTPQSHKLLRADPEPGNAQGAPKSRPRAGSTEGGSREPDLNKPGNLSDSSQSRAPLDKEDSQ